MTGADYFAEIVRQMKIVADDSPERDRPLAVLQGTLGAGISAAAMLYDRSAYAEAQDLIILCARMAEEANERLLEDDPEARGYLGRALARLGGIPIPEPKIPEEQLGNPEAAKAWAREILSLASTAPEKSAWLHVTDRCCFGGSVEACGKPIDGVQIIANGDSISAVCYCEPHGKIMADVVAEQRATSGAMTVEEIDRMASDA